MASWFAPIACALALAACGSATPASSAVVQSGVSARAAGSSSVAVSPEPGTEDASPSSQISFLGGAGTSVSDVHAVGSSSGAHTGVLRAYSTGTGESFIPAHAFAAGEHVSVSAKVTSAGASATVRTSFTVAHQAGVDESEFADRPGDPHAVQHYITAPTLTPSSVHITKQAQPGASAGDFFLAPYQGDGAPGPMIVDQHGNLVWFHPLPSGVSATNFKIQQYQGKPVLTWWQGRIIKIGFGQGEDVLYNTSYQHVATIRAGNGYHADLHEIRLTPEGTAWVDAFDPVSMNLTSAHGVKNGVVTDSVVQEIDVKTGLVMWEWHALGHIPFGESNVGAPGTDYPWDYVHINSVDPGTSGDVLLSSRNTWTLYDVDLHTGGVRWRLGGKHSSFKLGAGTHTYWQHDAEWQPGGMVSVFDNGASPTEEKQSRGLLLSPNTATHTVTLVKALTNPTKTLLATSQGNVFSLAGGNWLMGYGGLPNFTEYDNAGHVLFDATLGKNVQDFRSYMFPWSGQPKTAPSVVAKPSGAAAITVSVSWNGASEVASWRVLAGPSSGSLTAAASAPSSGFQSTISTPSAGPYVAVQALNASGAVIGTSATVKD
jgi:Arylsulfotransferase (ASST)